MESGHEHGERPGQGAGGRAGDVPPDDGGRILPWWAWGFVAAAPLAFLGLLTHWYIAAPPAGLPTAHGHSYTAWSHLGFATVGPFFMFWQGVHWFGAAREWWGTPVLDDWRGTPAPLRYAAEGIARAADGSHPNDPEPKRRLRVAAAVSLAEGVFTFVLLGISRALVSSGYTNVELVTGTTQHVHFSVHTGFGFWCVVLAALLYVICGAAGLVPNTEERKQHRLPNTIMDL